MRANSAFHLSGRLAADPEEGLAGSVVRSRVRLAVDRYDRSTKSKVADFFPITFFGQKAEFVNKYCRKGQYVTVVGEMRRRAWTDRDGNKRNDTDLIGDDIEQGPRMSAPAPTGDPLASPLIEDDDDPFGLTA